MPGRYHRYITGLWSPRIGNDAAELEYCAGRWSLRALASLVGLFVFDALFAALGLPWMTVPVGLLS